MLRTAAYARFSSDQQRATSIEDQLRVCRDYAARQGWLWQDAAIFTDVSISASSMEGRHGLLALLAAAEAPGRPFDVVLVDDSSRIARDLPDAVRTLQRLTFAGVRVIYISQSIDSANEQAETLVVVHGLVDGLYLREMSTKIRRGVIGQLTRGYATGSITYGYRTIPVPDPQKAGAFLGRRIEVDDVEAGVIRSVFVWYADGLSLPAILSRLHAQGAPAPRGGASRGVWRVAAVRRLLANQRYLGRLIYARTRTERRPGSRRSVQRPRPVDQWETLERPDLQIVSAALWARVEARRQELSQALARGRQSGSNLLRGRPARFGRSLFAGFLFCGTCGKAIGITSCRVVKGRQYRYLGCANASRNGPSACTNRVTAPAAEAEAVLLAGLQAEVTKPATVALVVDQVTAAIRARMDVRPEQRATLEQQRVAAETKVRHLLAAIEAGAASPTLVQALRTRETEVAQAAASLAALEEAPNDTRLAVMPTWVRQELESISTLLGEAPERTRDELARLGVRFTLQVADAPGERPHYRAVGEGSFTVLTGISTPGPVLAKAAWARS